MRADATCAICGRSILAGERIHVFLDGSARQTVCELCVARAERLGWRPEGAPEPGPEERHHGRGRFRGLLRHRPRRAGAPQAAAAPAAAAPEPVSAAVPATDPAAPGRRARLPVRDEFAPGPVERAVVRFNASEPGRTVAGLARTLGRPWVSVGAAAGAPDEIRITVAWELSWYQWGVDLSDELRPVFQLGKGSEIEELDPPARQWNASLGEDGKLRL